MEKSNQKNTENELITGLTKNGLKNNKKWQNR